MAVKAKKDTKVEKKQGSVVTRRQKIPCQKCVAMGRVKDSAKKSIPCPECKGKGYTMKVEVYEN